MKHVLVLASALALAPMSTIGASAATLSDIETIVVIYAENRSFDNLYGFFPGAERTSTRLPGQIRPT
jgi:phospholipase C